MLDIASTAAVGGKVVAIGEDGVAPVEGTVVRVEAVVGCLDSIGTVVVVGATVPGVMISMISMMAILLGFDC